MYHPFQPVKGWIQILIPGEEISPIVDSGKQTELPVEEEHGEKANRNRQEVPTRENKEISKHPMKVMDGYAAKDFTDRAIKNQVDPELPRYQPRRNTENLSSTIDWFEVWLYEFIDTMIFRFEIAQYQLYQGFDGGDELNKISNYIETGHNISLGAARDGDAVNYIDGLITAASADAHKGLQVPNQKASIREHYEQMREKCIKLRDRLVTYTKIVQVLLDTLDDYAGYCQDWKAFYISAKRLEGGWAANKHLIELLDPAINEWKDLLGHIERETKKLNPN